MVKKNREMEIVKSDDLQEGIVFKSMRRKQKDKLSHEFTMNEWQNLTVMYCACASIINPAWLTETLYWWVYTLLLSSQSTYTCLLYYHVFNLLLTWYVFILSYFSYSFPKSSHFLIFIKTSFSMLIKPCFVWLVLTM